MGVRYVFLPVHADARRVGEGRGGAAAQRSQRAARDLDLEELPRLRAAGRDADADARRGAAGRARARGRRRACCARRASSSGSRCRRPAPTCCASTTRPTGASTIPAAACVEPGPHGMTQLRVVDPGPLRLRIDVNAAHACSTSSAARARAAPSRRRHPPVELLTHALACRRQHYRDAFSRRPRHLRAPVQRPLPPSPPAAPPRRRSST